MESNKPKDLDEYKQWLYKNHQIKISSVSETHYYAVADRIERDFQECDFWKNLILELHEINDEYRVKTGYPLLIGEHPPELIIKPFDSFFLKTFRLNILENENFPHEPKGNWIFPDSWFIRIQDIVRTFFTVKFLDGVKFLIEKIEQISSQNDLETEVSFEAREEGYYAAHLNVKSEFEIPKINFETEKIMASVEIQITTQLQEVIRKLLHKHYEELRKRAEKPNIKWQWDYKSDEFSTNYLGHILHYIEGMILDIREKQRRVG
jgi:hypothetical protein